MSHLTKDFLDSQRVVLQEILDRLLGVDSKVHTERVSGADDLGTVEDETNTMLGLLSTNRQASSDVQAALKRLELGTYGTCEISGQPIPVERLEAVPWARYTIKAQQQMEIRAKQRRTQQYGVSSVFAAEEDDASSE